MKKTAILLFALGLMFNSCNIEKAEQEVIEEIIDFSDIDDAKSTILEANTTNRVVVSYSINNENYVFTFSDGSDPIVIPTNIVSEINENTDEWGLQIIFIDDQIDNLYFKGSSIGISTENIDLNPNNVTPLSALAVFSTPLKGKIRVVVPGKGDDGISIGHTFTRESDLYEIPVLGLYENYANPVEFHFLDVSGNELSVDMVNIKTTSVADVSKMTVVKNSLSQSDDMLYMEVGLKQAFDQKGELRWALTDGSVNELLDRMPNGNWTATSRTNAVQWHFSMFNQIDMLGEKIKDYQVPNLGHHEIKVIGDGEAILVGTNSMKMEPGGIFDGAGTLQEDAIVEFSTETGQIVNTYDFNTMLDNTRPQIVEWVDDWFHNNAIEYDLGADGNYGTNDDGVICSGRHQSAVFKFNKNSSEVEWILADHAEWPEDLKQYLLTPVDENGNEIDITNINFWPYGQHTPRLLPNGNLMMFDNGNSRGFYKETPKFENQYSRAVEYKIDEAAMTIQLVWEFNYNKDIYTSATGSTDYLAETNGKLIGFMRPNEFGGLSTPRIIELDENDTVVFESSIQIVTGRQAYRAKKFGLYEGIE